jgi:hypothetical protein
MVTGAEVVEIAKSVFQAIWHAVRLAFPSKSNKHETYREQNIRASFESKPDGSKMFSFERSSLQWSAPIVCNSCKANLRGIEPHSHAPALDAGTSA